MNEDREREGAQEPSPLTLSALTAALREALSGLSVTLDGETVGRLVAPTVDEELGWAAGRGRWEA